MKMLDVQPIRAFLLLGALSFHTVFEGLAVGLQEEEDELWTLFGSILLHKTLVALCLGMQLFIVFHKQPLKALVAITSFAVLCPLGIGCGMAVISGHHDEEGKMAARGILEALRYVDEGTYQEESRRIKKKR